MARMPASPARTVYGRDALYSLFALLICAVVIEAIYAFVIRPHAESVLQQRTMVRRDDANHAVLQLRSIYVILKDYEQQTAITLGVWALALLARQAREVARGRRLLARSYLGLGEDRVVLPEDTRAYSRPIEALPPDEQAMFFPRLLTVALNRFGATRSVQDAAEAVRDECEFELSTYDAQLSMVRFTAW